MRSRLNVREQGPTGLPSVKYCVVVVAVVVVVVFPYVSSSVAKGLFNVHFHFTNIQTNHVLLLHTEPPHQAPLVFTHTA